MCALQFCAHPHATCAQNASVVIERITGMGQVQRKFRIVVSKTHGVHAHGAGHRLQLAMAIGDADRADMIALDKEKFERQASISHQLC